MARIYNQQNYQQGFQGSAQSAQFAPIRAVDLSEREKQRGREKVAEVEVMAKAANRQYELDKQIIAFQGAEKAGRAKIAGQAVQSLLSLSKTAMGTFAALEKENERMAEEDALLASVGYGEDASIQENPAAVQETAEAEEGIRADATGRAQVAQEYAAAGGTNNQSVANALQQTSLYNTLASVQGNGYAAMGQHQPFLDAVITAVPEAEMPRTAAEAQSLVRAMNAKFLSSIGFKGMSRAQKVKLARTMAANNANTVSHLTTAGIKAQQAENLSMAHNFVSQVGESGVDVNEMRSKVSERYALGNLGFTGYSRGSNEAALKALLAKAQADGNTPLIRQLREVEMVPGNKGTRLGGQFDHLFDAAEKDTRRVAIQDYNLLQSEAAVEQKKSIQFFYDNPTPENRKAAVDRLQAIGTEDALKEATRLTQFGLGYDPKKKFELLEMQQSGQEIPDDLLRNLLDSGTINSDEFKQFATTSEQSVAAKNVDQYLKDMGTGLKVSMQGQASATDLSPAVRAQLNVRYEAFEDDLRRSILAEVKLNPGIANDKTELARIVEQKSQYLLQQPQYKLHRDTTKNQWVFAGDMNAGKNLASITVSPGVQDFTSLTPDQITNGLKVPRSEMDPTKDRFLDEYQLKTDVNAILKGEPTSARTNVLAKMLGLSPQAFVQSQMDVMGLPSLRSMKREQEKPQQVSSNAFDIKSAPEGMKLLEQEFGFPRLGAAYLAGNIQQESGWHGLRQWGQVAGDGTNRNGGLVSWASWADDSARLGAIERYYGKNIAQISEIDQLKYMVHEMKRRNPNAYRTFMNPNASEAALRRASYQYWGFGHEGGRYAYANNLLKYGRL